MSESRRRARRGAVVVALLALAALASLLAPRALRAATPRLQVYFSSGFTDQAYQKAAYGKVAGSWARPAEHPPEGAKAVVLSVIERDGRVPAPALHLASGSEAWDRAAIAAVKQAAPFAPLPKSHGRASGEAHWHFAYAK